MRYFRIKHKGVIYYAQAEDEGFRLLSGPPFEPFDVLPGHVDASETCLLAPVVPSKIIAVGLNYRSHALEMNLPVPSEPLLFLKPPTALAGPEDAIIYPSMSHQVDYEGELAIVIGKQGKNIPSEGAGEYIFGYTLANDITARDLQKKDGQWTRAKGFDGFCPIGPCVATDLQVSSLEFFTYLNGQQRQHGKTSDMIFSPLQIVAFVSQIMTLYPGDIILTGTPPGIGPMKALDEVMIKCETIGSLTSKIISDRR